MEIALYEAARKFLKEQSENGKLPSMKLLKAEKEKLLQQKKEAQKTYHYFRDYQKELNTVCFNVDKILGQTHTRQPEKTEKHRYFLILLAEKQPHDSFIKSLRLL